jgi:orotate phosphoribosyltransferase
LDRQQLARSVREVAYLEGDFLLRSGKRSSFYLDKYRFATRPEVLAPLGHALATAAGEVAPAATRLAGPELGAVPLVTAASLAGGLPFVIVRGAAKDYGTTQKLEGVIESGETVCVIEDVVTTGGAALEAVSALREEGLVCDQVLCVVDREEGAAEAFAEAGATLTPLFTVDEIRAA